MGAGGDGWAIDLGCIKAIREGEVCGMEMIDWEGRRSGKLCRTEVRKYWLNFGKGLGGGGGGVILHTHTHTYKKKKKKGLVGEKVRVVGWGVGN